MQISLKLLHCICNSRKQYVNPYDRASSASEAQDLAQVMAQNNTTPAARFTNIYHTAIAAGDTDKIMQGLYENYLKAKVKDPRMDAVSSLYFPSNP